MPLDSTETAKSLGVRTFSLKGAQIQGFFFLSCFLKKRKKIFINAVWTFHLVIPDTKVIRGKWGFMKVPGSIDGYELKDLYLAPVTGHDKRISVNGEIRKAIGKKRW